MGFGDDVFGIAGKHDDHEVEIVSLPFFPVALHPEVECISVSDDRDGAAIPRLFWKVAVVEGISLTLIPN